MIVLAILASALLYFVLCAGSVVADFRTDETLREINRLKEPPADLPRWRRKVREWLLS